MRIEWEDGARASFRRHLRDQDGMLAVLAAIDALADDPVPPPPEGFHAGEYHRLKVAPTAWFTSSTMTWSRSGG